MKTKISYSLLAAAMACGMAQGQTTAYTTPVGYTTQAINIGFNFLSPTVHDSVVVAGTFEVVTATTAQDTSAGINFLTALGTSGASGTYIVEISDANGTIQETTTWTADTVNVASLAGVVAPVNYKIRKADTVASIFGATNQAGLAAGSFGSAGADQVWIFNGTGWNKYYYDLFAPPGFVTPGWVNVDTSSPVDPASINLIYADGFCVNSVSGTDIVISGEVKPTATELTLAAGFNFVGSVVPVGSTIATAFGSANQAGLSAGSFGSAGADQVWVFNGSAWDKYYYDLFAPPGFASAGWVNVNTSLPVDPTLISLPTGYAINAATAKSITQGVPMNYNSL
jgi:hypothetical protein